MKLSTRTYQGAHGAQGIKRILAGMLLAAGMIFLTPTLAGAKRYIVRLADSVDIQAKLNQTHSRFTLRRPTAAAQVRKTSGRQKKMSAASQTPIANPLERILFVNTLDTSAGIDDIRASIGASQIVYIEEDYPLTLFDFPTDRLFPLQWYLVNDGQSYLAVERIAGFNNDRLTVDSGLIGEDVGLRAHYVSPFPVRKRPVIAIIDTGVDDLHPELQGQMWFNTDDIPGNGIDDDHNGLIDDYRGYDFSGDSLSLEAEFADNDPSDQIGHGSHLAGIIAAIPDGEGIVGICPQALIMPLKIFPNGFATIAAQAVVYAVNNGADVINISWGTPFRSLLLDEVFAYATASGVFVAVASGNSGTNQRFQPADIEDLFTVGATNSHGYVTSFSTFGAHIDIVAPGRDILSIRGVGTDMFAAVGEPFVRIVDSMHYLSDGTSMAAPMVAAAAGFLLSVRPDLSLSELESALRNGARDIVQPYDSSAQFPGPDSLSGAGVVNISRSLEMISGAGMTFWTPPNYSRQTEDFVIKGMPINNYTGAWTLEFGAGSLPETFQEIASGASLPADSLLFTYQNSLSAGLLTFRLTDDAGRASHLRIFVASEAKTIITSPSESEIVFNLLNITGSVHGPDFDSLTLWDETSTKIPALLFRSTSEFYSENIFTWQLAEVAPGNHTLILNAHSGAEILSDTVTVTVKSLLHSGWPKKLPGFLSISPIAVDLDGDGPKEIIIGSSAGLFAYNSEGTILNGFPVSTDLDCRSVPTVYDIDGDGALDIVYTTDSGLHVINQSGDDLPGFPRKTKTGQLFLGFPTPRVMKLALEEDSAIVFINAIGQLRAYRFNGESYFFSLDGLFSRIDPNISNDFLFRGLSIPHVTNFDRNQDGRAELISSYSSPGATSGIFVFNGRDGQAANELVSARVLDVQDIHGVAYGDVDGDGVLDALMSGVNKDNVTSLWLRRNGEQNLPGWPVELPEVQEWIGSYPILADLNGDEIPEAIAIFTEFDISRIYVFNLDGTPFLQLPGKFTGEIRTLDVILGGVVVADITGDGVPEIVARSGLLLPGSGFEKLHAITPEGMDVPGFPITTAARPITVTSVAFLPLIDDIDNDGLVEIVLSGSGNLLTIWDMPGASNPRIWDWPRFLNDITNSATGGSVDQ